MTSQQKTATLSEWAARFAELIDQAEADGVEVEFTTCCCGGGLDLSRDGTCEVVV